MDPKSELLRRAETDVVGPRQRDDVYVVRPTGPGEEGTKRLGLPRTMRGATVVKVFADSPLATHFRPLDVIQTVNGRAIRSADDVVKALERRADGESMEVVVDRVNRGMIERLTFRIP